MEYNKLGHIAKIQTGPFGSQLHQSDYKPAGIPCIMPCNIGSNLNIICDNIAYISEDDLNRLAKHKTNEGDIVYSRRGDIEKCAYISSREAGWLCGTGCLKISIDSTIAIPKYVAYLLSTPDSKAWLVGNAVGTTMLNLNTTVLSDFPISLPDLDTQQKVVDIIDAIADKIELNKRINDNLEQQAQALYKSWFVDFEPFKDEEFIDSELGMIPKGWAIGKIEDLTLRMASGGTPKSMNPEFYSGDICWFTTKELVDGFLIDSEKHISQSAIDNSAAKIFPKGSVLMAIYAAPTVGRLGILSCNAAFNQAAVALIPKVGIGSGYIYLTLYNERNNFNNLSSGAAQQNLNVGLVKNYPTRIPSQEVLNNFETKISPIFMNIERNQREINNLTRLRDTLLPKLMSGEIKINEIDC